MKFSPLKVELFEGLCQTTSGSGMMAPVFGFAAAGRSFSVLFFSAFLLSLFVTNVLAVLVYDRLTLLSIQSFMLNEDASSSCGIFHPPLPTPVSGSLLGVISGAFLGPRNHGGGEEKEQVSR